ncbi:MAG: hypothetical protein QNK31_09510 [Porticoccus sp.]|nr:hypothetical protein [Porticoccus sp.]
MLCKVSWGKVFGTTGKLSKLSKLRILIFAALISALLSGCLVDKKKVDKISRSTDTLRIYQAGDVIEYNINATTSNNVTGNTTQYGTMRIEWANTASITDPISGGEIFPDLKETTTITYDGSTQPDAIVVRYISQINTAPAVGSDDPGIGSIILHAIHDQLGADYWPYIDGTVPPNSPVITPVIFESPLMVGNISPQAFSIMECGTSQCNNEIYQFSDGVVNTVGDSKEIDTGLGVFTNPFEVSYSGGIIPVGAQALSFLGDIRDACGTSADRITHSGTMFVMPEIGIVQMTNQCTNLEPGGDIIFYNIEATNTSFTF